MPRGVAIPELRERLFQAADRLLARGGPSALVSRAITAEAGCAKGVLHNHFTDLDGFLAEFVRTRFQAALEGVAQLQAKAGRGRVESNIADMVASLFESPVLAAHSIVLFRPSLVARLHGMRESGEDRAAPSLGNVVMILADYLEAEKKFGHVLPDADTRAVGLALVATAHHLLTTRHMDSSDARDALNRVLNVLLMGVTPRTEEQLGRPDQKLDPIT